MCVTRLVFRKTCFTRDVCLFFKVEKQAAECLCRQCECKKTLDVHGNNSEKTMKNFKNCHSILLTDTNNEDDLGHILFLIILWIMVQSQAPQKVHRSDAAFMAVSYGLFGVAWSRKKQ